MDYIIGVNLLPSTGEFTYDTIPYLGQRVTETTSHLDQSLCQRRPAGGDRHNDRLHDRAQ